jgi:aminoglycoside 3-N-acetyltransferase
MLGYRDFIASIRDLGLGQDARVIAHVSLPAFGDLEGGGEAVLGALLATCTTVIMPAFTSRTMIIPSAGPAHNALQYGSGAARNSEAEFYHPAMPADPEMGDAAEILRRHPSARRSAHPLLSFIGVNADQALLSQTLEEPLAPIAWLVEQGGFVLLLGADHTANISLHYAARRAGRKTFLRWALTSGGVVACPGYPGCGRGFQAIAPRLDGISGRIALGTGWVEAIPLRDLLHIAVGWMTQDPQALLCSREGCAFCGAVRESTSA